MPYFSNFFKWVFFLGLPSFTLSGHAHAIGGGANANYGLYPWDRGYVPGERFVGPQPMISPPPPLPEPPPGGWASFDEIRNRLVAAQAARELAQNVEQVANILANNAPEPVLPPVDPVKSRINEIALEENLPALKRIHTNDRRTLT